jgi:hypothetical protein
MKNSETTHDATFARTLLGRRTLLSFAFLLAYGGGLWLHLVHEVEGATEAASMPGVVHWLRDSSLALPLVALSVFMGGALARRVLERYGAAMGDLVAGALVTILIALYASIVMAVGNPIHGLLFPASHGHGGYDLPVALHAMRDGLLALSANELLAGVLAGLILGRLWVARRLLRSNMMAWRPL